MTCRTKTKSGTASRRGAIGAGAAVLALTLTACGAGGGTDAGGGDDALTVLVEGGGKAQLEPVAAAFTEETGTEVTFVELPYDGLYDRLSSELGSGQVSFDVAALDAIWLSAFADGLAPLDDLFTDEVVDDLFPALVEEAQIDGQFVGMPVWTNAQTLFYRTDLFSDPEQQEAFESEYGYELAPPTTWEEYDDVAAFLTQDTDGDGSIDLHGTDVKGAVETEWLALVLQAGADGVVLDDEGDVIIDDAAHKKALDAYVAPLRAGSATGGAAQVDWAEAQNLFYQGSTAMTRFWAHAYTQVPEDSAIAGDVGVTTMPAGPGGSAAVPGAWYLSVPQATEQAELSQEFVRFAIEHNELGIDTSLGLAATVSALESGAEQDGKENLGVLVEALEAPGTAPRPATAKWQQIVDAVLVPMLQKATAEGADTQALLDDAKVQIEEILG
ncbi:ABC transporter substrate-binding protein [Isoptericola sp. 178]|uniref:ABC transporter substrate-binding protein n=1 Tax=Isoptericola sp. 178 TaxID=3064651 RepID=UPI002713142F|nr:extracellular solute-binding protein [Isoptericola sp. 178]MDO8143792.1 extracellular solute-binding protein [Isoptericola sp. 178]